MDPQQAWLFGLASMLAVFLYFYHKTSDIRYSFMVSLLWGKILASIFWLLGLDYPLFSLYKYYPGYGYYTLFTVTANMAIFLLLLISNALAAAWPEIRRELGPAGELPGLPARRRWGEGNAFGLYARYSLLGVCVYSCESVGCMRNAYRLSMVVSALVGFFVAGSWYRATGDALDAGTYMRLASVSTALAGFVFTAEQLLMIVLGNEDSRVARIIRERNPEYLTEPLCRGEYSATVTIDGRSFQLLCQEKG